MAKQTFQLARCGCILRVTSQTSYSPEYITPTHKIWYYIYLQELVVRARQLATLWLSLERCRAAGSIPAGARGPTFFAAARGSYSASLKNLKCCVCLHVVWFMRDSIFVACHGYIALSLLFRDWLHVEFSRQNHHVIDRKFQSRLKKQSFKSLYFCLYYFLM
jgi:hypothetical protein